MHDNGNELLLMTQEYTAYEDKPSWLNARFDGIGASDAAVVIGESPYKCPLELYEEKRAKKLPENEELIERFYWGHSLEKPIAERFVAESGKLVVDPGEYTIFQNKDYPFIQATPDRLIVDGNDRIPLEIKTASPYTADAWDDDIPLGYKVQLQHQMLVLGADSGYVAVLIGFDQFKIFRDDRDDDFISRLIKREETFWKNVQEGVTPEADGSEGCAKMLLKHHPNDNGETIILPQESIEWYLELEACKEGIKNLKAKKQLFENRIKDALGDNTYGILPGNTAQYSWKTQEKAPYEVKGSKTRVLRVGNIK